MSKIESSATKFEVKKFNGKGIISFLAKEGEAVAGATGSSQDLSGNVSKTCRYADEDWEEMDLKSTSTIQLYFADEVMYNVMDEETVTRLWSSLKILYMTKNLSNKLYLKKQLYGLHMNEGTTLLEHLNFFNEIISELLAIDVKIKEEDKALIFLSSLSQSYDQCRNHQSTERKLLS